MARYVSPNTQSTALSMGTKFKSPNLASFLMGGTKTATSFAGKILNKTKQVLKKIWPFVGGIDQYGNLSTPGGGEDLSASGDIQWGGRGSWKRKNKSKSTSPKGKKTPLFNSKVSRRIDNLRVGDSLSNVVGKIYTLMLVNNEYETTQRELEKSFEQERIFEEKLRQREITNYLNSIAQKRKQQPDTLTKISSKKTPTGKQPEPPKAPPSITDKIKDVATKVGGTAITGGAVIGGLALSNQAIAAYESSGSPDLLFGDRLGKNGQVIPKKGAEDISPESMFGKKLSELTIQQVYQVQSARVKRFGAGGAAGKYGMVKDTLRSLVNSPAAKQSGITESTVFSSEVQDKLHNIQTAGDIATLQRSKVDVTATSLAAANELGAGGAASVYSAAASGSKKNIAELLNWSEKTKQFNKTVGEMTPQQYIDYKSRKVGKIVSQPNAPLDLTPSVQQGQTLVQKSISLIDSIKNTVEQEGTVIFNSINTLLQNGESHIGMIGSQKSDKSPLLKAQE